MLALSILTNVDSENRPTESCIHGTNLLFSLDILFISEDVKTRGRKKEVGLVGPREATTSSVKLVKRCESQQGVDLFCG